MRLLVSLASCCAAAASRAADAALLQRAVRGRRRLAGDSFLDRPGAPAGAAGARFRGALRRGRFRRMERARGTRRHPDPRGRIVAGRMFGFRRGKENVKVGSLTDVHRPVCPSFGRRGLELPVFELPGGASVFARERWTGAPMMAGLRRGTGAILWVAVPPGERGYERFPYLLQALADLGMEPPFRSSRLWAFFDSAYRSRVDLDYFAARWRESGIAALHVAAWHFYEPDAEAGRLSRQADRGLSSRRDPGVRLARAAARQREILGRPSGVARKDRRPAGCPTRLAQADEPDQSRLLPRRVRGRAASWSAASIGTASTWPSCISNRSRASATRRVSRP